MGRTTWFRSRVVVGPLLLGLAGLTACGVAPAIGGLGDRTPSAASTPTVVAATPAETTGPVGLPSQGPLAPSATASTSPPSSAPPAAAPTAPTWRTSHLRGKSPDFSYDLEIPVFAGTATSGAINTRVRASAEDGIRLGRKFAGELDDNPVSLTDTFDVTTNDGRTAQIVLNLDLMPKEAAHSSPVINTTVIDVATGRPVMLKDVFRNEKAAFRRLKPVIKGLAEAEDGGADDSGLTPREANWAAWQTSNRGMTFFFQDYQLGGHGTRSYTVQWSTVRPLMKPAARALLAPA